jgi:hypothetical protein
MGQKMNSLEEVSVPDDWRMKRDDGRFEVFRRRLRVSSYVPTRRRFEQGYVPTSRSQTKRTTDHLGEITLARRRLQVGLTMGRSILGVGRDVVGLLGTSNPD